jgi:transcription elongation factor Elf1
MATPGVPHVVLPITCTHCNQAQVVQVRARTGFAQVNPQTVRCVKCKQDFDTVVPDDIVGGPFLP